MSSFRAVGLRRRGVALCLWLVAAAFTACGTDQGAGGQQPTDFDALDVDVAGFDVDVSGLDVAGYPDAAKSDTVGSEVSGPDAPDAADGADGADAALPDAADAADTADADVPPPACVTDATCADDSVCTTDSCVAGSCVHAANNLGCNDGSVCTLSDVCKGGACVAGASLDCTDGNVCTADACDPLAGCVYTAQTGSCDDGDPCTVSDACTATACQGGPANCDDGNACTTDSCGAAGCVHVAIAEGTACDDASACTTGDHCASGVCTGTAVYCPASENPCALAVCDLAVGCTLVTATTACDDGDPCTQIDTCAAFTCLGSDVTDCNDGNACTVDVCVTGTGCDNATAVNCDDANSCTTDACDMATGCSHTDLPGETPCDDGNACTMNEVCTADGVCAFQQPVDCNDYNSCTGDSCDTALGCLYAPLDVTCTDDNPCTIGDTCVSGYCVYGYPDACNDGNPCTDDSCLSPANTEATPGCQHMPNGGPCDDGDACTGGDTCSGAICLPGTASGCDDNNACTNDFCSTVGGGCGHGLNADVTVCDDGNACTNDDACDPVSGKCVGATPVVCQPDGACLSSACDPLAGCTFAPLCDDGDPCTADACDANVCSHSNLAIFHDSFANGNAAGWTLGAEWQIAAAQQGPVGDVAPGDPPLDHSPGDTQLAGVDVGGNANRVMHDFAYLTSPVIDTTKLAAPQLEFWRWLDTDAPPYMTNVVEAWNGQAWQPLWLSTVYDSPADAAWTRVVYDLSAVSNAQLQFRIGFAIGDPGVFSVGSWSVDDVTVGDAGTCVQPLVVPGPKAKPLTPPRAHPHP